MRHLNPESVPAPIGRYSHLSVTEPGERIATFAGQVGAAVGVGEQTRQVFAAIESLLTSQGAGPADLVRLQTFVAGRENLAEFSAVRNEVFDKWFPSGDYPPNTLVIVAGLALEQILVEIEGSFAVRP